jgi:crotonobetaine/carnitine-CoA ligase
VITLTAEERTIPTLLRRAAERYGDRPCVAVGEHRLTYRQTADTAACTAGLLAAAGVERGDRVLVMAENRWELLALWLACAWRGAIFVPVNPAARGSQLAHIVADTDPRVLVAEDAILDLVFPEGRPPAVRHIWALGDDATPERTHVPTERFVPTSTGEAIVPAPVTPRDPLAILYTSGTTGASKGVVCPHAQFTWWGENVGGWLGVNATDVLYTCLPLHHTNALNAFVQALLRGARYEAGPRFSASRFWQRMIDAEATVTYLLGAMVSILVGRDPSPLDRAHGVSVALAPATPVDTWRRFEERFGIRLVEGHGMTETNGAIGPRDGEQRAGWMGRVMPGFAARVVDEQGDDAPAGTAGELLVRADEPLAFAEGYWRRPEATAAAWRDGWFHTGDRVVRDEDGYFRFVDRLKDAIRRRGENISSWEVEQVLGAHPSLAAAAVVPVPSELGEDDVMAFVVTRPGVPFHPRDLMHYCEPRLAAYAVPRYVEVLDALPLTENGKVRKAALRERGIGPATWDRDADRGRTVPVVSSTRDADKSR